jgi:hypothetical protein
MVEFCELSKGKCEKEAKFVVHVKKDAKSGELLGSQETANLVDVVSCHFHAMVCLKAFPWKHRW